MKYGTYERGHILFNEEDLIDKLYIVHSGFVLVEVIIDDESFCVDKLGRGSVLYPEMFLNKSESKMLCRCQGSVSLCYIDHDIIEDVMNNCPQIEE